MTHHGNIVEYIIRKNGYSISDLALKLNVNRRSVYNWFQTQNLKADVIYRIGCIIKHDFSKEFPHLFTNDEFQIIYSPARKFSLTNDDTVTPVDMEWKDKYLNLLEKYNEILLNSVNSIKQK